MSLQISPAPVAVAVADPGVDQVVPPTGDPDQSDVDPPTTVQTVVAAKPLVPTSSVGDDSVLIPASLLAHLHAVQRGDAKFDKTVGLFVDVPSGPIYYQARVIASDIHSVPVVDDALRERGYAVQSQRTRVEEIRNYAATLKLMVYLVGGTVFVFGLFTLCVAMTDNTLRKRRSIGILRAMGSGRLGVAYVVCLRGLLIGLVAGINAFSIGRNGFANRTHGVRFRAAMQVQCNRPTVSETCQFRIGKRKKDSRFSSQVLVDSGVGMTGFEPAASTSRT